MDKPLEIEISFQGEDVKEVISALEEVGAEDIEEIKQLRMTGVVEIAVVGVIVVYALTNLLIKLLRLWKCGVVVDARGTTIFTEKNCDLPRGSVLIISSDGTESQLNEPSELQINDLISQLIESDS